MLRNLIREAIYTPIDIVQRFRLHGRTDRAAERAALKWGYRRRPRPRVVEVDRKIRMNFEKIDYLPLILYYTGSFERYCFRYIDEVLRGSETPQTVLDVGGMLGYHTLQFARMVGPAGHVLTIEALPAYFNSIQRNLALNTGGIASVDVVNTAVGAADGDIILALPEGGTGGCYGANVQGGRDAVTVPMTTIDAVVERRGVAAISLFKMDIEGSEMEALKGAVRTIERFRPPLMIELNDTALQRCGSSSSKIVEFFVLRDYEGFLMSAAEDGSAQLRRLVLKPFHETDEVMFIPRERTALLKTFSNLSNQR